MANLTDGFIYFISATSLDLVKIGYSANHPNGRLKQLDTASPVPLVLLGYRRGSVESERWIHRLFAEYRVRREWFRFEGSVRQFIKQELAVPWRVWITGPPFNEVMNQHERSLNESGYQATRAKYAALSAASGIDDSERE